MSTYLFTHIVDWSLLNDGFSISLTFHELIYKFIGKDLQHGDRKKIKVIIDNEEFVASINNNGFNKVKYDTHPDILQIRYNPGSPISLKLRDIFSEDYNYLVEAKANSAPRKKVVSPYKNQIAIYATDDPDVFEFKSIKSAEVAAAKPVLKEINELEYETQLELLEDKGASIKVVEGLRKVRMLDRSIGDTLKKFYDYCCQMTGEKIGDGYGVEVVEAHHIVPFTQSVNNDMSNIIIISPNYHRIIHKAKPIYDPKQKAFIYPNGVVDKIKLNKHL